jgi:hypothetical protein
MRSGTSTGIKILHKDVHVSMKSLRKLILVGIVLVITLIIFYAEKGKFSPAQVILTDELIPECKNKTYVAYRAEYVIEGVVEKVKSEHLGGIEIPDYYVDVKIEKFIKGKPKADRIQVVLHGSTRYKVRAILLRIQSPEEIEERFPWIYHVDAIPFREGERVKIYFEKRNGDFLITCSVFGIEKIPKE